MIVGSTVYVDGRRSVSSGSVEDIYQASREPGNFAWVKLQEPNPEELRLVADQLGLDESAMKDVFMDRHHPRLELRGKEVAAVLEATRYVAGEEKVRDVWIHVFTTGNSIVTASFGEDSVVSSVRERIEGESDRLRRQGPSAILHEIFVEIFENYGTSVEELDGDL
jgi:magnesium transporter